MSVKLLPGVYPQISSKYTRINSKLWTEETIKKEGHRLLSIKLYEITLKSTGKSTMYATTKKKSPIAEVAYATINSYRRTSNQEKARLTFDTSLISVKEIEQAVIAEINMCKKRVGKDVPLIVDSMITIKDGIKCRWHNIYKEGYGEVMVLSYVNNKHIGRMERADALACLELGWEDDVCEMNIVEIKKKKFRTECGNSHITITQLNGRRK